MSQPSDHIAHGTPEMLREFMGEHLNLVRIQAELGVTYAEIGDDVGLGYAVRNLIAYTRAVAATMVDLKALKAKAREEAA